MSLQSRSLDSHAAFGVDSTQLQEHLRHCARARSPLHQLRGVLDAVDGFVSPRVATTLALLAAAVATVMWLAA